MAKTRSKLWLLPVMLAAAGLCYLDNWRVQTVPVTLRCPGLPEAFSGLRIVQISDLHGRMFGRDHKSLLGAVRDAQPDLIAITGDLADEDTSLPTLRPLLEGLVRLAPVFYVTGNHEWVISGAVRRTLYGLLDLCGVIRLENDYRILTRGGQSIVLAGVDDPNGPADQKTPAQLFSEIWEEADDAFVLLLAHRNDELARWAHLGADVVLCGHAHGGVVRLPGVGGLLGTHYDLFPDYDAGLYESGRTAMYVSPGFGGIRGLPLRLCNRPALCILELRREPAANP